MKPMKEVMKMIINERISKAIHVGAGVVVAFVILACLSCMGYFVGTHWFEKKDFVGQKYEVYKVYGDNVICRLEATRGGWVCKAMPSEFKEAIKTIFNFDGIETLEGSTTNKSTMIEKSIREASSVAGVDHNLVKAVIKQESGFNPDAISKKNCKGLMQLCSVKVSNPFNVTSNIYAGTFYLKALLNKYNGNERIALAAYNAGETAVDRYRGIPPYAETQNFVAGVLHNKELLKKGVEISSN
jgi:hypothetical protein